jgi:hypothetical protein
MGAHPLAAPVLATTTAIAGAIASGPKKSSPFGSKMKGRLQLRRLHFSRSASSGCRFGVTVSAGKTGVVDANVADPATRCDSLDAGCV